MSQYSMRYALEIGQRVTAADGMEYIVRKCLGRGGQGEVYLVEGPDGQYALKWYRAEQFLKKIRAQDFYKHIRHNVEKGVPKLSSGDKATQFIWPKKLVDWQYGSFGYLMQLFDPAYDSFPDVIMGRHRNGDGSETPLKWRSWFHRVTAGLNIVRAFEILHAAGYSYQDLNEGGFSINMDNGDVMICDCDNVAPDKTNLGILGKLVYEAPEVARGEKLPDRWTDQYSLAVVLFQLMFNNHPMEGVESISLHASEHLSRQEADLRIYSIQPHYCLDRRHMVNPPDEKRHRDVRQLCRVYPSVLLEAFEQVFTKGIEDPMSRLSATEWRKVLLQVRDLLVWVGDEERFFRTSQDPRIPKNCRILCYDDGRRVLCMPSKILYQYHFSPYSADFTTPVAKIIPTKQPEILGLYNAMQDPIIAHYGKQTFTCACQGRIPLLSGMTLTYKDFTIAVN